MSYTKNQMWEIHNKLLQGLIDSVADTGWVELTLSSANVIWYGSGWVRRVGKVVQLKFDNIRSSDPINRDIMLVNGLPGKFVPASSQIVPILACPSSGMIHGGYITIKPDANVMLSPLASTQYIPSYGIYAQATYLVGGGTT
ncbi:hypothetical protein NE619_13080 [Anaerovorax odorimutans]|uniref:Uncharacterized protein n=1 Tax=Anaerovorax odorimutans TaxID=109327 RepID=A0ABT1RR48_9FIRM|nr:hypothetical protein [Anaerovorax odorimutans]MCQ4637660.1 hypothetical protein [Anaerovorax odorimutans]